MPTVSKFASYHTAITTGYTNPSNGFNDDGVYATAAPAKNAEVSAYWGFAGFTTEEIPDGAIINSVTIEHEFKVSTTASIAEEYFQIFKGTTGQGTEQSDLTEPLTDKVVSHQVTNGITLSDLRQDNYVRLRTRSRRGNSNTAVTFYIDYVKITVDYTTPTPILVSDVGNDSEILFTKTRTNLFEAGQSQEITPFLQKKSTSEDIGSGEEGLILSKKLSLQDIGLETEASSLRFLVSFFDGGLFSELGKINRNQERISLARVVLDGANSIEAVFPYKKFEITDITTGLDALYFYKKYSLLDLANAEEALLLYCKLTSSDIGGVEEVINRGLITNVFDIGSSEERFNISLAGNQKFISDLGVTIDTLYSLARLSLQDLFSGIEETSLYVKSQATEMGAGEDLLFINASIPIFEVITPSELFLILTFNTLQESGVGSDLSSYKNLVDIQDALNYDELLNIRKIFSVEDLAIALDYLFFIKRLVFYETILGNDTFVVRYAPVFFDIGSLTEAWKIDRGLEKISVLKKIGKAVSDLGNGAELFNIFVARLQRNIIDVISGLDFISISTYTTKRLIDWGIFKDLVLKDGLVTIPETATGTDWLVKIRFMILLQELGLLNDEFSLLKGILYVLGTGKYLFDVNKAKFFLTLWFKLRTLQKPSWNILKLPIIENQWQKLRTLQNMQWSPIKLAFNADWDKIRREKEFEWYDIKK